MWVHKSVHPPPLKGLRRSPPEAEVHALSDHKLVRSDVHGLKEQLGNQIQICKQEYGTPEMLFQRGGPSKMEDTFIEIPVGTIAPE